MHMIISLTPEQQAWLDARVARGDFPSVEDAVCQLIDERIAERAAEEGDDLAWARPLVDAAIAQTARGQIVSHEEHEARMAALLTTLKG